jgi:hypothetical protein
VESLPGSEYEKCSAQGALLKPLDLATPALFEEELYAPQQIQIVERSSSIF